MNFKKIYVNTLIITIIFAVFFVGVKYGMMQKGKYDNNKFTLEYLNETSHELQIRYKYELSFSTSKSFELPMQWDKGKPLFYLLKDGLTVNEIYLSDENRPIIPEVSKVKKLKPNESTEANFVVNINQNITHVEELIKFDTKVIIEELKENRWVPTYQVILMKRGNYWSLDKGPIEYIETIQ